MSPFRRYTTTCILISIILFGCDSSRYATAPPTYYRKSVSNKQYSRRNTQPRFINNVEVKPASNNQISMVVVESYDHGRKQKYITDLLLLKYAQKLEVQPQEINNYPLYRFIEDWYGVRYRYGGTNRSGIDCSAFTQKLYDKVYCTDIVRTSYQQYKMSDVVWDKDMLNEGDLVFFRTRGKYISHVGIYLKNNYFVHASRSNGIMISSLDESYWKRVYAGAGKITARAN